MLQARSIAVSEPYALPTGSLTVLCLMAANPGSPQVALARMAGINSPTLVGIIDQLEREGLVSRERSATDRRRNLMQLTGKGEQVMQNLFDTVTEIEAPIRAALGEDDMARMIALVERAVTAMGEDLDPHRGRTGTGSHLPLT